MTNDLLLFIAIGFAAQMVDGAIGMAYGITATTALLSMGVSPATASAAIHMAEVFATATHPTPYAYFMRPTQPPERCEAGEPLTFQDVEVYRLGPGGRFDLTAWLGTGGISYRLSAEAGVLRSSRSDVY